MPIRPRRAQRSVVPPRHAGPLPGCPHAFPVRGWLHERSRLDIAEQRETASDGAGPPEPQSPERASTFLMGRANAEFTAAEDKRSAMVTKATAVATLGAALIAVVAAPVFGGSVTDAATRWILLAAIVVLLVSIGFAAAALLTNVDPGDRVIREELENWTTDEFAQASVEHHERDFTAALAEGAHNVRAANERAESWMLLAVAAVAFALVLLAVAFAVEIA